MKLRSLLIACFVLLSTGSILAQATGAVADPITGTWTGDIGLSETTRMPVKLELKFDVKSAVSGIVTGPPQPGEIKIGTFDPKTGALKLEIDVKEGGGAPSRFVFQGSIVKGTATGSVNGQNETGTFIITKAAGQRPGSGDESALLRTGFGEVSGWVAKAADLVPADKYTYKPTESVRTFGQQIAHIADAHNYFCARAAGRNVQWTDAVEKGSTDKVTVVQKLKQSIDTCNTTYESAGPAGPLMANIAHTNLHYGNVITYMRMLGLVPPSS